MATAPSTQTDEAHEAEVAKQAEIAAEVDAAAAASEKTVEETPQEEVPAAPEVQLVTIQPKADVEFEFPIAVSVVGSDDLIFTGPSDTVQVKPEVAEQITYSPAVEVAE